MKTRHIIIIALLVFMPKFAHSADINQIDGIWTDPNIPGSFYSIHQHGPTIVLIDLLQIEDTNTLAGAYYGLKEDLTLSPLAPAPGDHLSEVPIEIQFVNERLAVIFFDSKDFGLLARDLVKIYK